MINRKGQAISMHNTPSGNNRGQRERKKNIARAIQGANDLVPKPRAPEVMTQGVTLAGATPNTRPPARAVVSVRGRPAITQSLKGSDRNM